jgi:hypothetical protein
MRASALSNEQLEAALLNHINPNDKYLIFMVSAFGLANRYAPLRYRQVQSVISLIRLRAAADWYQVSLLTNRKFLLSWAVSCMSSDRAVTPLSLSVGNK